MNAKKLIPLLVVAAVLGCQRKETKAPVSEMQPGETKAPVSSASTASETAAAASSSANLNPARAHEGAGSEAANAMAPQAAPAAPAGAGPVLSGTVSETMNSGGYTYMKLKTKQGDTVWAAVRETPVKSGQTVTVSGNMVMKDFESKTLKRKFDTIVFGNLEGGGAAAPAGGSQPPAAEQKAAMDAMVAQHAAAAKGPADAGDVKVPKAEGADARTVAEVFAKKAELKDKPVTIRGKVVKSLSGIMGRNWIHLRDGSGSADKKNNDLTVTTNQTAAVGDVVVVKGTVHVDRDFGAGYAYPVIVEEASIAK